MKKKFADWRTNVILVFLFLFGAALAGRLFVLQIIERKLFEAQALGQQTTFNNVIGSRGQIFCQNSQKTKGAQSAGEIKTLSINKDNWTISANPKEISDKNKFAESLAKVIPETQEKILAELEKGESYAVLAKNLTGDDLKKIKSLNLKGLSWQNLPERLYPQEEMASQMLGFLGGQGSGQYGVEGYYDDSLKGKSMVIQGQSGLNSLFSDSDQPSSDGADVYLTIDYNIQFQAEQLLKQEKAKNNIDSGQIIVMKPDTGRILALANFPNFNPNNYSKETDMEIFQDSFMQKLFEPGSIMKPFTMAVALNEGKITQDTTYVDTGAVVFPKNTIHNFENEKYGLQTMTQVLESSINTGAVFAQQQVSHKTFFDYFDKFGFFRKTGVDLQGEVTSRNEALRNGGDVEYATASFGQGIEMTPMQIARGYCALANGGKLVKPFIVDKIVKGKEEIYTQPEISKPLVSQATLLQLNAMLINVVDKGFNSVAKIPGYYFAGKTGTAQIPLTNGKGYMPDNNTIQSFVGYGPVFNPQFLIMVKLDNPKVPKSSLSAVPLFKQLSQYIINYWQIPPDYDAAKDAKK